MGSKAKALLVDVAQGEATNELMVGLKYTLEAGEQHILGLQICPVNVAHQLHCDLPGCPTWNTCLELSCT